MLVDNAEWLDTIIDAISDIIVDAMSVDNAEWSGIIIDNAISVENAYLS